MMRFGQCLQEKVVSFDKDKGEIKMGEKLFWTALFILTAACPPLAVLLVLIVLLLGK